MTDDQFQASIEKLANHIETSGVGARLFDPLKYWLEEWEAEQNELGTYKDNTTRGVVALTGVVSAQDELERIKPLCTTASEGRLYDEFLAAIHQRGCETLRLFDVDVSGFQAIANLQSPWRTFLDMLGPHREFLPIMQRVCKVRHLVERARAIPDDDAGQQDRRTLGIEAHSNLNKGNDLLDSLATGPEKTFWKAAVHECANLLITEIFKVQ